MLKYSVGCILFLFLETAQIWCLWPFLPHSNIGWVVIIITAWVFVSLLHEFIKQKSRVRLSSPIHVYDLTGEHFLFIVIVELVIEELFLETGRVCLYLVEELKDVLALLV